MLSNLGFPRGGGARSECGAVRPAALRAAGRAGHADDAPSSKLLASTTGQVLLWLMPVVSIAAGPSCPLGIGSDERATRHGSDGAWATTINDAVDGERFHTAFGDAKTMHSRRTGSPRVPCARNSSGERALRLGA